MDTMKIDGIELILSSPTQLKVEWVGQTETRRQLEAAWLISHSDDLPMNPRIVGKPGIGKTTLASAVANSLSENVYIFQCTVDTRPEDLIITPVIGENNHIRYHASPLVTAMLKGGVCILDEGNRMGEKSWASLAPLLDNRRYVESIIAGIKIPAHPEFRIAVTMNEDASTFDVPDYIQSRLQPQIEVGFPSPEEERAILKSNLPHTSEEVLDLVTQFLMLSHENKQRYTTRDGVNIARYALKLLQSFEHQQLPALEQAMVQILGAPALQFFREQLLKEQLEYQRSRESVFLLSEGDVDIEFIMDEAFYQEPEFSPEEDETVSEPEVQETPPPKKKPKPKRKQNKKDEDKGETP